MTYKLDQRNPLDALFAVAKKYPGGAGGIEGLAEKFELSATTIYKKLEKTNTTHHLQLSEFIEFMSTCAAAGVHDPYRPLRALNWQMDHVAIHVPRLCEDSNTDLTRDMMKTVSEIGDMARKLDTFLANDGLLDQDEFEEFDKEISEAMAALQTQRNRALAAVAVKRRRKVKA